MIRRLIIVNGAGRCGTALVAHYFGEVWPDRYSWIHRNQPGIAVAHEPCDPIAQYWECIAERRRGKSTAFLGKVLLPQLELLSDVHTLLITDNKIGRWFIQDLDNDLFEVKIIHLTRDPVAIVESIEGLWGRNKEYSWCHRPDDLDRISAATCQTSALSTAEFHVAETQTRWERGRAGADVVGFETVEISYEDFISSESERQKLEEFCGFSGVRERLNDRVNVRKVNSL